ncbi:Uncharacterised protein [Lactobacillus acidophilus]|nr:Uncharacterised protein [Lactobacillus acidophilus]
MIVFFIFHWLYYAIFLVIALLFPIFLLKPPHDKKKSDKHKLLVSTFIHYYLPCFSKIFLGGIIILTIFILCFEDLVRHIGYLRALLSFLAEITNQR